MIIISSTPVRISFFGGGTDYPDFFIYHGGAVLGCTINKHTHVSISTQSGFFEYKVRIAYSKTELVSQLDEIMHPSVRESLRFTNSWDNLDIHIFSDLPARTGLGSSSSFTVGFLNALYALKGQRVSKQRLAEEACYVEQQLIKEHVGSQDQFHASFGGLNIIEFQGDKIQVRPLIISQSNRTLLEQHLMMFYTSITRHASEVVKEQIDRTKSRSLDPSLHQMKAMVFEAEQIFSSSNSMIQDLSSLLHESWQIKKSLSSKITNSFIDEAYSHARKAGALGGKLCGAGSGGFLLLLVPPEKQNSVRLALKSLLEVPIRIENEGSSIIYMKHD